MEVVTNGVADWLAEWKPPLKDDSPILRNMRLRGRYWLGQAGLPTTSEDLVLLAFLCHQGVSELYTAGRLDEDWVVAGEVLDNYVGDHDAELLCELVPLPAEYPVGSMTPEVTAVHTALLLVCGAMRDAWGERMMADVSEQD